MFCERKDMIRYMEKQTNVRIVTLKDLGTVFIHHLWIIILSATLCMAIAFMYNAVTFVPKYESTATLYILRQNEKSNKTDTPADFSLALNVVNDCTYLLKSHAVLDDVIDELSLNTTYESLAGNVSTSNPENTRILEVTVKSDSPKDSKEIVDSLCKIGTKKIMSAMGFNQVNLYEEGTLETDPCNKTGMLTYLILGVIVASLVYAAFFLAFLLDDRIRSEEDIEHYLGLSILGDIPNAYEISKNRYGYYSAYKSKENDTANSRKR